VRADQRAEPVFAGLALVSDDGAAEGPAAGLLAARRFAPGSAWLALATDMPLVDPATLAALVAGRDPQAVATAFLHADGTPEPLCTIWEPRARQLLERAAATGSASLRRLLGGARLLAAPDPARLASVNSPAEEAAARGRLRSQDG